MQSENLLAIGEVAHALNVSHQTILRFVQSGQWKASREGKEWRIPQSSLRNHILQLLGKSGPRAICEVEKENVSKMERKSQHLSELARYYIQKDMKESPTGEFTAHEALELLKPFLRRQARRFSGKDIWLRDDLYQDMALAICLCFGKNTLMFYAYRATARARDSLRKERLRGRIFQSNISCDVEVGGPERLDCSSITELFKIAGMSFSLLEEFGIHLVDEGENHDHVSAEGCNHRDERDDGRNEDVHQGDVAGANSPTRAA